MILSAGEGWAVVALAPLAAGAAARARATGLTTGLPKTCARAVPRREEPRRAFLGLAEMICEFFQ